MQTSPSISLAIIGSGGAGALTTGDMLLEAACAAGWHGLFTRTMGPQIRGGEAAALLRLAGQPVECPARPVRPADRHRLAQRRTASAPKSKPDRRRW